MVFSCFVCTFPNLFSINSWIDSGAHFRLFREQFYRVVGVKRSPTSNQNSMRKLALKTVASEEGRGELALSGLGARREIRGDPPWGTEVRKILQKNGRQDERRKDLHAQAILAQVYGSRPLQVKPCLPRRSAVPLASKMSWSKWQGDAWQQHQSYGVWQQETSTEWTCQLCHHCNAAKAKVCKNCNARRIFADAKLNTAATSSTHTSSDGGRGGMNTGGGQPTQPNHVTQMINQAVYLAQPQTGQADVPSVSCPSDDMSRKALEDKIRTLDGMLRNFCQRTHCSRMSVGRSRTILPTQRTRSTLPSQSGYV